MTCDGEKVTISCESFLKGEWKLFKIPKEAVLVPWKEHQVINSTEWHCFMIKTHVFSRTNDGPEATGGGFGMYIPPQVC